ncbi:denticleless protein [Dioscorea alata]|uniref:Denticleless protein n=1 Tax=Dioscorea alata TaxID=55571 RepID=A0ACB7WE66_DIOAL|nr:denticleless protein [Dioscorea alata]
MQRSILNSSTFFGDVVRREIDGFRVNRRPYLGFLSSEPGAGGAVAIEHQGLMSIPLVVSFCKMSGNSHFLAVGDEDGFVSLYDTRRCLPSAASCMEKSGQARVFDWIAHTNAIFDVCWIKDDSNIVTASGDQSIKLWNAENRKCMGILGGHTGSVKSISPHASNPDIIVSGSRDGSFALWDLRCNPTSTRNGETRLLPVDVVSGAHGFNKEVSTVPIKSRSCNSFRRKRAPRASPMSITSVLCLKDSLSIATGGALNSIVKFWDTRNLSSAVAQACPQNKPSAEKDTPSHGISSLSQDSHGAFITASCMDHRIYLYEVLHVNKGATKVFSGSKIDTFYVKSALSPDGAHLLSGSSDGNAYIWRVNKPEGIPVKLEGHEGEVTAVDWCSSEIGKLVTSADDSKVRVWNMKRGGCISSKSPTSLRKRVVANAPRIKRCRRLVMDDPATVLKEVTDNTCSMEQTTEPSSPIQLKELQFSTPESGKKRNQMEENEALRTPKAALSSPSSVLNPPPSLKRKTILDYFHAAS